LSYDHTHIIIAVEQIKAVFLMMVVLVKLLIFLSLQCLPVELYCILCCIV